MISHLTRASIVFIMSLYLEQASCSSGTHARASGIIFFTHTQSKLMGLYMKRGARCGGAQVRPGSPTAAAMSDATSSTMLVSHHRYFIAHSLVSLFFLSTSSGLHQIHLQHNFL